MVWAFWLGCGSEVHPCTQESECAGSPEEVAACCLQGASTFGEAEALCVARGTVQTWYPAGDQGCALVATELPVDDGTPTFFKVQVMPLGPVSCAIRKVQGVVVSGPDGRLTSGFSVHFDGPCRR